MKAELASIRTLPVINDYYGMFLDEGRLKDLVYQERAGLRHFTIGIVEDKGEPAIFYAKHERLQTTVGILRTKDLKIVCSLKPLARVIKNRFYPKGKLIFWSPYTPYVSVDFITV